MNYEVFSPVFDSYVMPIPCATKADADALAEELRGVCAKKFGASCGWRVREEKEQPPVVRASAVSEISPGLARRLMALHGYDAIIVMGWRHEEPIVRMTTTGSDLHYSEQASAVGKILAEAMAADPENMKL